LILLIYGGAQQLLLLLDKYTPKDKYTVAICVLQENNQVIPQIESENIKVFSLNKNVASYLTYLIF